MNAVVRSAKTLEQVSAGQWLAEQGWAPFPFQQATWQAMAQGRSGLLHATTGSGKTYAIWLGVLQALSAVAKPAPASRQAAPPLSVLWITPMRALANDTLAALQAPLPRMAPAWTIAARTGDSSSAERARQNARLPTALVTTPESLSLLLTQPDARERLAHVRMVVVDEWHELLGSKRGVQVQLALARLRHWQPALQTWGLSATLGDLAHARDVLTGPPGVIVSGLTDKALSVDTLLPAEVERFPWAGHLGLSMLDAVVREVDACRNTLVFTNTRSQAELWYQALLEARPDWAGTIALHHGSLDKAVREWVETGLKAGSLKAVVATSSLDLGVDFSPVERVLQVGSCKGIARLMQRAGRSGHAPGQASRLTLVPTHSLEIVEAAAARRALAHGQIESVHSPDKPFDVLIQHVVTVALGGGFDADQLFDEVRHAHAFHGLTRAEWDWVLDFAGRGGDALKAYPDYQRIERGEDGRYRVVNAALARRHRMSVGTIVSDASITVSFVRGAALGQVEESFIARMRPGDAFLFGGRMLELVRVHDMTAQVKLAKGRRAVVPRWNGGKMPISSKLADAMQEVMAQAERHMRATPQNTPPDAAVSPELHAAWPLLAVQHCWSQLPRPGTLLIERIRSRDGHHLFVYPFAGRPVHLSLASLWAYRLSVTQPRSFSMSFNDYGFELMSRDEVPLPELQAAREALLRTDTLLEDVLASINATQLSQRRFREIARIAGLVFMGYPGQSKSMRQVQASSSLFFDVFRQYDPANLLLSQAQSEVLRHEFELPHLARVLGDLAATDWRITQPKRFTPLAFPLLVERLREQLSTQSLQDRLARLLTELHAAADA
ncbi:MAG: ligase-associated DNA damage response DEXH box helicase [Aquabacterium sp.]